MKLPLAQLQRHQLKNLKNLEFPKKHLEILEFLDKNSRIPYVIAREQSKGSNLLKFTTKIQGNIEFLH